MFLTHLLSEMVFAMGQFIWCSSLKGRTWNCDLPSKVLQDVFCKAFMPLSAVWCFMKTSCHLGSSGFWESGDFCCFLKHFITLSLNKQNGSIQLYLSIPGLSTYFARRQKYVCWCRCFIWSYVSHLLVFIGLCFHFYSFSTFRGSWLPFAPYLSSKTWMNLTYPGCKESFLGAFDRLQLNYHVCLWKHRNNKFRSHVFPLMCLNVFQSFSSA